MVVCSVDIVKYYRNYIPELTANSRLYIVNQFTFSGKIDSQYVRLFSNVLCSLKTLLIHTYILLLIFLIFNKFLHVLNCFIITGNAPIVPGSPKSVTTTVTSPVMEKSTVSTSITTITTMTTPTLTFTGTTTTTTVTTVTKTSSAPTTPTQPVVKLVKLPASNVATSCDITNNQEQIVEKAKQVK